MIVVRVLVVTLGVLLLVVTLLSSVKTVILPRSVPVADLAGRLPVHADGSSRSSRTGR